MSNDLDSFSKNHVLVSIVETSYSEIGQPERRLAELRHDYDMVSSGLHASVPGAPEEFTELEDAAAELPRKAYYARRAEATLRSYRSQGEKALAQLRQERAALVAKEQAHVQFQQSGRSHRAISRFQGSVPPEYTEADRERRVELVAEELAEEQTFRETVRSLEDELADRRQQVRDSTEAKRTLAAYKAAVTGWAQTHVADFKTEDELLTQIAQRRNLARDVVAKHAAANVKVADMAPAQSELVVEVATKAVLFADTYGGRDQNPIDAVLAPQLDGPHRDVELQSLVRDVRELTMTLSGERMEPIPPTSFDTHDRRFFTEIFNPLSPGNRAQTREQAELYEWGSYETQWQRAYQLRSLELDHGVKSISYGALDHPLMAPDGTVTSKVDTAMDQAFREATEPGAKEYFAEVMTARSTVLTLALQPRQQGPTFKGPDFSLS